MALYFSNALAILCIIRLAIWASVVSGLPFVALPSTTAAKGLLKPSFVENS